MEARKITKIAIGLAAACRLLAAADDDEIKRLPEAPGKVAVAHICFDCHDSGAFRRARHTRDEWADKVGDMVERGASGTEDEIKAVVDYLTRCFGPDSKIYVNTAPMIELKTILGLTAQQANAMVEYRNAHGPFKQWQDLQKTPGVDAEKIAAKKDLMAF